MTLQPQTLLGRLAFVRYVYELAVHQSRQSGRRQIPRSSRSTMRSRWPWFSVFSITTFNRNSGTRGLCSIGANWSVLMST
jgi:hypothetical protein